MSGRGRSASQGRGKGGGRPPKRKCPQTDGPCSGCTSKRKCTGVPDPPAARAAGPASPSSAPAPAPAPAPTAPAPAPAPGSPPGPRRGTARAASKAGIALFSPTTEMSTPDRVRISGRPRQRYEQKRQARAGVSASSGGQAAGGRSQAAPAGTPSARIMLDTAIEARARAGAGGVQQPLLPFLPSSSASSALASCRPHPSHRCQWHWRWWHRRPC